MSNVLAQRFLNGIASVMERALYEVYGDFNIFELEPMSCFGDNRSEFRTVF